jgi:hypothetical protein
MAPAVCRKFATALAEGVEENILAISQVPESPTPGPEIYHTKLNSVVDVMQNDETLRLSISAGKTLDASDIVGWASRTRNEGDSIKNPLKRKRSLDDEEDQDTQKAGAASTTSPPKRQLKHITSLPSTSAAGSSYDDAIDLTEDQQIEAVQKEVLSVLKALGARLKKLENKDLSEKVKLFSESLVKEE